MEKVSFENLKTDVHKGPSGKVSSDRVAFLVITAVALFLVIVMVFKARDVLDIIGLWTTMMGTAATIKGVSKRQENTALKIEKTK